jgi:hypothetical protein
MTKKTVGAIVSELSQKTPDKLSILDIQAETMKDYQKELLKAVDRGCARFDGDFFIHVATKAEKVLANTFRNYFIDRKTCPTPNYDQSVFKYNRIAGQIEYLWTIPDRDTAHHLKMHASEVAPEERQLLYFIFKFADGTLFRLMKKFNGEKVDTPELEKDTHVISLTNGKNW